jgi:hypothetical protein
VSFEHDVHGGPMHQKSYSRHSASTMLGGLHEWRSDLEYSESHSDMQGAVMALLRKYEVKLRAVPLDRKEIYETEPVCPVCGFSTFKSGETLVSLFGPRPASEFYAHEKCVRRPSLESGFCKEHLRDEVAYKKRLLEYHKETIKELKAYLKTLLPSRKKKS